MIEQEPVVSRRDPLPTILTMLAVVLGIAAWRISDNQSDAVLPALESRVNPNTAPWCELMALPTIGEATARRIVEYRQTHTERDPVFRSAADLEAVPDIGPRTIARIAPYLRFGD